MRWFRLLPGRGAMTIAGDKAAARRAAAAARDAAHAADRGDAGEAAARIALDHPGLFSPRATISGYLPVRSEFDPRPLMTALASLGHTLCVPLIEGRARPLAFLEWHPGVPLRRAEFGISVPDHDRRLTPDILLVPLLAFDRRGYRLGYGGGFYDRTLAALPDARPLGLAYAAQEVPEVPTEPTDMPVAAIITERRVIETAPPLARGPGAA